MEEHDSISSGIEDPEIIEITRHDFDQGSDHHWKHLMTKSGIVRNLRDIESRFRALYITRDNLDTLLQGFDKPSDETRFIRDLLLIMKHGCVILTGEEVLNAIEDTWTGNLRTGFQRSPDSQKVVYARFRISYFVDSSWGPVRELAVLAVNHDALDVLVEKSQSSFMSPSDWDPWRCSEATIVDSLQNHLRASMHAVSTRCMQRFTFSLKNGLDQRIKWIGFEFDRGKKNRSRLAQAMVQAIYGKHKVGRREPSEPFLRTSYCNHIQSCAPGYWSRRGVTISKQGWEMRLTCSSVPANIHLSEESKHVLCLYTLQQSNGTSTARKPAVHELADQLIRVLFIRAVFQISRRGKAPLTSHDWQETQATYSSWLDPSDETLKMTHAELVLSIITWIRELGPDIDRLPKADAYMLHCDITPEGKITVKKWMESLSADPDTTTAAIDKEMQAAVLGFIAKRSTGKMLWSFDNPIPEWDPLFDL
jgi:hypothetical protein